MLLSMGIGEVCMNDPNMGRGRDGGVAVGVG